MKGFGYFISTLSIVLLGLVAWPKPDEPGWKAAVLLCGMAGSVIGLLLRFLSHLKDKAALATVAREVERPGA